VDVYFADPDCSEQADWDFYHCPEIGDLIGFRIVRHDPDLGEGFDILGYIAFRFDCFEHFFIRDKNFAISTRM
jgi:hypothetical protein